MEVGFVVLFVFIFVFFFLFDLILLFLFVFLGNIIWNGGLGVRFLLLFWVINCMLYEGKFFLRCWVFKNVFLKFISLRGLGMFFYWVEVGLLYLRRILCNYVGIIKFLFIRFWMDFNIVLKLFFFGFFCIKRLNVL